MRSQFFEHMAREFSHGNMRKAAERFNYPSAIYLGSETLVYHSPKEMGDALDAYKKRLTAFEHCQTKAQVISTTPKRGEKQIIWVNWLHYDRSGNEIEQSSIKYFCCDAPDGGFRIQLAEYITAPSVCSIDRLAEEASHTAALAH